MIYHKLIAPKMEYEHDTLMDYLIKQLKKRGLLKKEMYYRVFDRTQIKLVLDTGTDRTSSSNFADLHNEKEIIRDMELDPKVNSELFTYVSHFDKSINGLGKDICIAIYDASEIISLEIYELKNRKKIYTQGFAMFKNPQKIKALLGVYTDILGIYNELQKF